MDKQKLIKKVEKRALEFRSRGFKSPSDEKRHDHIQQDEKKWMWNAHNQLGWSYAKIGSVFNRDPRAVKKAVQNFEYKEQIPNAVEGTEHEKQLRAMISHLIKSLSDLRSPIMPCSPEPIIFSYDGRTAVAGIPIKNEPVFQALMEHLKDKEIPMLWKDADIARHEYFLATTPHHSLKSTDPEFASKARGRIEALSSGRDKVWQQYHETTFTLRQKLKELLLLDKLPGKCRFCSRP